MLEENSLDYLLYLDLKLKTLGLFRPQKVIIVVYQIFNHPLRLLSMANNRYNSPQKLSTAISRSRSEKGGNAKAYMTVELWLVLEPLKLISNVNSNLSLFTNTARNYNIRNERELDFKSIADA